MVSSVHPCGERPSAVFAPSKLAKKAAAQLAAPGRASQTRPQRVWSAALQKPPCRSRVSTLPGEAQAAFEAAQTPPAVLAATAVGNEPFPTCAGCVRCARYSLFDPALELEGTQGRSSAASGENSGIYVPSQSTRCHVHVILCLSTKTKQSLVTGAVYYAVSLCFFLE